MPGVLRGQEYLHQRILFHCELKPVKPDHSYSNGKVERLNRSLREWAGNVFDAYKRQGARVQITEALDHCCAEEHRALQGALRAGEHDVWAGNRSGRTPHRRFRCRSVSGLCRVGPLTHVRGSGTSRRSAPAVGAAGLHASGLHVGGSAAVQGVACAGWVHLLTCVARVRCACIGPRNGKRWRAGSCPFFIKQRCVFFTCIHPGSRRIVSPRVTVAGTLPAYSFESVRRIARTSIRIVPRRFRPEPSFPQPQ